MTQPEPTPEPQNPTGEVTPPASTGTIQYFPPRGAVLPQRTFQRRTRNGMLAISVIAALALAVIALVALFVGAVSSTVFTATGAVQVDCQTRQALSGAPIKAGDEVRIFRSESGEQVGKGRLDDELDAKGGSGACFVRFRIPNIADDGAGYVVEAGSASGSLYDRAALESGILLDS